MKRIGRGIRWLMGFLTMDADLCPFWEPARYNRGGIVHGTGSAPTRPPERIHATPPLRDARNDRTILEDLADVLYDLPTQDQAESYNEYAKRLVSRMNMHGLMVIRK